MRLRSESRAISRELRAVAMKSVNESIWRRRRRQADGGAGKVRRGAGGGASGARARQCACQRVRGESGALVDSTELWSMPACRCFGRFDGLTDAISQSSGLRACVRAAALRLTSSPRNSSLEL
jgi:hypothetical protein